MMNVITLRALALTIVVWLALGALATQVSASSDAAHDGVSGALQAQEEDGTGAGAATENDDRISVQVWTVLAAGGAAAVGLVLYAFRIVMGWVKPPPPQQEEGHH